MGRTVVGKILQTHLIEGKPKPGSEVTIRIDQTLTQDATGTMAYLQLEALQPKRLETELSVSYVDHNTTQIGYENFDDHLYLRSIAKRYGIYYSMAGNGICHQVHLERFGEPAKTLLGSDSHTPTGGGIGMFAVGAGGLDVAVAMAKGQFTFTWPRVVRVVLTGTLKPWVAAKDVILKLLQLLSTKGNVGTVLEYQGPGVLSLSVPERATIANMGAELGVTTSVFPSDENTRRFLEGQKRKGGFVPLAADDDAAYDDTIGLDLSRIEPLAARPHSPDNVAPVSQLSGVGVDQVAIGSCTNSSYKDLMTAAAMLAGRMVHPEVSFVVAPGSRQVLRMIADNGALGILIGAGARIAESACGFCIGNSQAPGTDSVSVRTSNRNFLGRSGTKSAKVYLASVETAVATALTGRITDPRTLGIDYPEITLPETYAVDDSMIIPPQEEREVEIIRGPNIGVPPENEPLGPEIVGVVAIKVGDMVTTDHIMPAGDKLKYRSNVQKYAEFVFAPLDETFFSRALENKKKKIANVVVGGESYGQGSSREHAAICPMYLGVKAVVAKTFERIHTANLVNSGILPLCFENPGDYDIFSENDAVALPGVRGRLERGERIVMENRTKKKEIGLVHTLSERQKDVILAGGRLNYLKSGGA
ncbi:MAG: aconitate hydratase [Spirochaetes bacterium]|nr:aconitate hydratase [Spirochaetota bacterium]